MSETSSRWVCLLPTLLLLSGCEMQSSMWRVSILVLVPFVLIIGGLWWLNRGGAEESWEEQHFPDKEDDDEEDHFLM